MMALSLRKRTAVHEGSHAIAAEAIGLRVRYVTIAPAAGSLGCCVLDDSLSADVPPQKLLLYSLAAAAGEELVTGLSAQLDSDDRATALQLISAYRLAPADTAEKLLESYRTIARAHLSTVVPWLTRTVDALLKYETLSGNDILILQQRPLSRRRSVRRDFHI